MTYMHDSPSSLAWPTRTCERLRRRHGISLPVALFVSGDLLYCPARPSVLLPAASYISCCRSWSRS